MLARQVVDSFLVSFCLKALSMSLRFRLVGVLLSAVVALPQAVAATNFPDVSASDPHYQAIQYLRDRTILNGYPDGLFRPDGIVTRAEIIKIAANGAGIATVSFATQNSSFPDVANNHPLKQFINWAQTTGVVKGYSDGSFRPEAGVTRGEAAKILLKINNLQPDVPSNYYFLDVPQTLDLAPYVYFSVLKNLISANGNRYGTGIGMKRGDVAEMMYRVLIIKQNNYAPFGGAQPTTTSAPAAKTLNVSMSGFRFNPPAITINVGDTIVWKNLENAPHHIVFDNISGQTGSGVLGKDDSYSYTFTTAGTFNYHCQLHAEMIGSVQVL